MLKDVDWSLDRSYASSEENEPIQFYLDGLYNSEKFDLLLGYFSSSALNVLSLGIAKFIHSGGTMRLVINNFLSQNDKDAIVLGQKQLTTELLDFSNIEVLKNTLNEYGIHFFNCLAWLIKNNRLQIVMIKPKNGGIAHFKEGVFYDKTDSVSFNGSCNFTGGALLTNLESLRCNLTWDDDKSTITIEKRFNNYFSKQSTTCEYLNIDEATTAIADYFGDKDLNDLMIEERELLFKKQQSLKNTKLKVAFDKALEIIDKLANAPKFPHNEGPRQYQIDAYNKWIENKQQGIFAMATGTGKTLTSLNCLLEQYNKDGTYKAVIIVPTIALLNQWNKECKKFNFKNIINVSIKEPWPQNIAFLNAAHNFINVSFIIVVTYATFYRKKFQQYFKDLPKETLLIADEVHNMGSPKVEKILSAIHLTKRIGLSATPERQYDELGNTAINCFFNEKNPYIFSYSMKEAMDKGWLCQYTYIPHLITLTDTELNEYIKISKQLLKYFDTITKKYKQCKEVEILLLKRKRIIHKAEGKLEVFKNILQTEFKLRNGNLRYTLIYVPEGIVANYEKVENYEEDDDDCALIDEYTKCVSSIDNSIMVSQYTATTKKREDIINRFQDGSIHVLTSMKCLDEGVDVPRAELAIFCASTGNPRQFVQRRGRVLRVHKDKRFAIIHDLIVVPNINDGEEYYDMEKNLVKKELERVVSFSKLSLNKPHTYEVLKSILDHYTLILN